MAEIRPTTVEALSKVDGFSEERAKKFGENFLSTCRTFCTEHAIVPNAVPREGVANDDQPAKVRWGRRVSPGLLYLQLSPEHKMLLLNVNPSSARLTYDQVVVNKLSPVSCGSYSICNFLLTKSTFPEDGGERAQSQREQRLRALVHCDRPRSPAATARARHRHGHDGARAAHRTRRHGQRSATVHRG